MYTLQLPNARPVDFKNTDVTRVLTGRVYFTTLIRACANGRTGSRFVHYIFEHMRCINFRRRWKHCVGLAAKGSLFVCEEWCTRCACILYHADVRVCVYGSTGMFLYTVQICFDAKCFVEEK